MPSIIQALERLQEREGWLPEPSLRALAQELGVPLHRVESVSTFYTHFRRTPPPKREVRVCRDLSCMLAGGVNARAALEAAFGDDTEVVEVSCLGRCEHAPVAEAGRFRVDARDTAAVVRALEAAGAPVGVTLDPPGRWAAEVYERPDDHYGALITYLGRLSVQELSEPQSHQLSRYMAAANYFENIGDMVETNMVDAGKLRLTEGVEIAR